MSRNGTQRVADGLADLSATIAATAILLQVAVILIDVVGRTFGAPFRGAQDLSQMGMVLIVFGGMALCDRLGGHIAVDVFERSFPAWLNRAGDVLSALLGALIFLGIAWTIRDSAAISRMLNLSTNIINLPKAWFQYAVCAFSLVTAAGMILRGVAAMAGEARKAALVRDPE